MKPTHRIFTSARFALLVTKLLRNRRIQLLRKTDSSLINLGCGGNILPGFLNVDYSWRHGVDLIWDIRRIWPIESNSVEGIFFEHALEHFEWQDAVNKVLPEAFRVMKSGAVIRVSVPDAEMTIDKYLAARNEGLTSVPWNQPPHEKPNRLHLTPMGAVNNTFRRIFEPYYMGHKFGYDFQTLEHFLFLSGFRDIRRTGYLQGRDPRLLVDYEKRRDESLYVEAIKPFTEPDA